MSDNTNVDPSSTVRQSHTHHEKTATKENEAQTTSGHKEELKHLQMQRPEGPKGRRLPKDKLKKETEEFFKNLNGSDKNQRAR